MLILLDQGGCFVARSARPWNRMLARLRAHRLDSALARGAPPDGTVALALRAQALVREPTRRDLARSAQRVLATATRPPGPGRLPVPVCQDRVRDSADEFEELIRRLLASGPVSVRGVAQASVLLCDARGPLYHRASQGDLRSRVHEAASALSPLGDS